MLQHGVKSYKVHREIEQLQYMYLRLLRKTLGEHIGKEDVLLIYTYV